MQTKKKGTKSEYKSKRYHVARGACVVRAGGSHGLFDLIALYDDRALLIQVKTNRWPRQAEMEALSQFSAPSYGRKIVERWDDYKREPLVREMP